MRRKMIIEVNLRMILMYRIHIQTKIFIIQKIDAFSSCHIDEIVTMSDFEV